jgi:hypothetical protein
MKRQRLVLGTGLALAAALGLIGVLHGLGPDREAIRAAFAADLEKIDALEPVTKDRRLEEFLANEDYKTHARAIWLKAERLHGPAHAAATADEAARKAVVPFLARCKDLSSIPSAQLPALNDEARALQDAYGTSRHGKDLAGVRKRIAERLSAETASCSELAHFRFLQQAQKDRRDGRYAPALRCIDAEIPKHPRCEGFQVQLSEERIALRHAAAVSADRLKNEVQVDWTQGRKADAVKRLERALPDYEGLPEAGPLQALLRELGRR